MPIHPTSIERRERRARKRRRWDLRWAEANEYERWCALQDVKELWRARKRASVVSCEFQVRFGVYQ
jgi:hypothetical protein